MKLVKDSSSDSSHKAAIEQAELSGTLDVLRGCSLTFKLINAYSSAKTLTGFRFDPEYGSDNKSLKVVEVTVGNRHGFTLFEGRTTAAALAALPPDLSLAHVERGMEIGLALDAPEGWQGTVTMYLSDVSAASEQTLTPQHYLIPLGSLHPAKGAPVQASQNGEVAYISAGLELTPEEFSVCISSYTAPHQMPVGPVHTIKCRACESKFDNKPVGAYWKVAQKISVDFCFTGLSVVETEYLNSEDIIVVLASR